MAKSEITVHLRIAIVSGVLDRVVIVVIIILVVIPIGETRTKTGGIEWRNYPASYTLLVFDRKTIGAWLEEQVPCLYSETPRSIEAAESSSGLEFLVDRARIVLRGIAERAAARFYIANHRISVCMYVFDCFVFLHEIVFRSWQSSSLYVEFPFFSRFTQLLGETGYNNCVTNDRASDRPDGGNGTRYKGHDKGRARRKGELGSLSKFRQRHELSAKLESIILMHGETTARSGGEAEGGSR